jgi:hypothetical protein
MFAQDRPPKIAHAQHRPNAPFRSDMAATNQQGPNLDTLGPTSAQLGSKMAQGTSSAQVEVHMASKWTTSRPNLKSSKYPFSLEFFTFFAINDASFERVPSCTTVDVTWTSMCITLLLLGVHLHRFGPNFGWPFGPFPGPS